MAKRLDKTLADYVVGGVMPALLIGLLVSLCFFLLELAYSGLYMGQMKWILFFFIVGTVLIARISMRGDISERAGLYGIALAIAAGLAMVRFVDIPQTALGGFGWLIPFSLMSIIWWSAHKLTQDSTWDDGEDDDGGGLLDSNTPTVETDSPPKTKSADWFDRYQTDRQEEQRKKKPGLMVVYFSLAALPLFGVGQGMIPASNVEGRHYAFWMLTIYVGCGLGMLLTTSFLGLRRYLRGRRLQMPASMTALWLGLGTAMILSLMVLSAVLLPRPQAEYNVTNFVNWATSRERDANKTHFFEGSSGKSDDPGTGPQNKQQPQQGNQQGKNRAGNQQNNRQGNQRNGSPDKNGQPGQSGQKNGSQGQGQGKQSGGQSKQGGQGQGKTSGGKNDPNNQQGEGSKDGSQGQGSGGNQKGNTKGSGKQGENGKGSGKDQGKEGENGKDKQGEGNEKSDKDKEQGQDGGNDQEKEEQKREEARQQQKQQETSGSSANAPPPPPPPPSASTPPTPGSLDWIKWLIYGAMLIGILFALWKWGRQLWNTLLQLWNEFLAWWRNLLPQKADDPKQQEIPDPESNLPPKPFAWFTNPLLTPNNFKSMDEMIRYSFAALLSWAYEQKLGRQPDETATEFAQRLGQSFKHAHQDIRKLADLYSVVTYAQVEAPGSSETILRNFWSRVGTA